MHLLDRPRRNLAIGLAGLAGYVDATGFLSAEGYFTSFMSGNTTRLGVDLIGDSPQAMVPAGLIAAFVIGVVAGAVAAELAGPRRKLAVLSLALALLAIAAMADARSLPVFLGASALAMGVLNNAFRRDGEVAVGVTYMTGALVRFGQGLAGRLLGQPSNGRLGAGGLWLGLVCGAVSGALCFAYGRALAPWLAVAICAVLLLAAARLGPALGEGDGFQPDS